MLEQSDYAYCKSCGKEFELPCRGWHFCPDCFHQPQNIQEVRDMEVAEMRKQAHKDKAWLDKVIDLPYLDRLNSAWRRGHKVIYPKERTEEPEWTCGSGYC